MANFNDNQSDLIATALAADSGNHGTDCLREAVLAQTLWVLRRRRVAKRCAVAACLAGCYVAGMATVGLWQRPGQDRSQQAEELADVRELPAPPTFASVGPNETIKPPDRQIVQAKPSTYEVLRRSGDRCLENPAEISLAVRGYAQALKAAPEEERAISPGRDSWLLMALKHAKSQEFQDDYQMQK